MRALGALAWIGVREEGLEGGEMHAGALRKALLGELGGVRVDYAQIVDEHTLEPVADARGGALVAVAAYVGATRLIDNLVLGAN